MPPDNEVATHSLQSDLNSANQTLFELIAKDLGESSLHTALKHHLSAGGHRLRLAMGLSAGSALGLGSSDRQALALACELIHNASLIHDDLQDQDPTRRGQPAVWAAYGSDVAVCAGDYLLSAAYRQAALCPHRTGELIAHIHRRVSQLICGQGLDLELAKTDQCTCSLETYQAIARGKSGTLLALPMELCLLAAGHTAALMHARAAGEAFAIAYQISDDLADLENDIRHQCLNLVHSLIAQGHPNAVDVAITEAKVQLEAAVKHAEMVPAKAGHYLISCAMQVMASLDTFGE